jgi:hypothetical protein
MTSVDVYTLVGTAPRQELLIKILFGNSSGRQMIERHTHSKNIKYKLVRRE